MVSGGRSGIIRKNITGMKVHCHVVRRLEWDRWNGYILSICSNTRKEM